MTTTLNSTTKIRHLTNDELCKQLSLRDDLTDIESELLDRLTRAGDAMKALEDLVPACYPSALALEA